MTPTKLPTPTATNKPTIPKPLPLKREVFNNGFHKNNGAGSPSYNSPDYDSATTATTSSPEPDEYTRNYVSRISQGFSGQNGHDDKRNNAEAAATAAAVPVVKVDILKRREIFEKAARENESRINSINNNGRLDFGNTKSIKERLSILERQKSDHEMTSVKSPKQEVKTRDLLSDELESVKPLREILSNLEKCNMQDLVTANAKVMPDELNAKFIKERLISLDASRCKDMDKRANAFYPEQVSFFDKFSEVSNFIRINLFFLILRDNEF